MKRLSGLLGLFLLATPVFAQDVDFGAFSDFPAAPPSAPAGNRGAAPARGAAPTPPPVDRLVHLRDVLLKAEAPLTKEQETALNGIMNTEIPAMRKTIQTHGQEMMAKLPPVAPPAASPAGAPPAPAGAAPAAPPAGAPAAGAPAGVPPANAAAMAAAMAAARGGTLPPGINPAMLAALAGARGGPSASSRVPAEVLDALEVEMTALNDALFTKLAAAPALDEKQRSVLTKMSRDQIKSRGGFDALRINMEDAKAPFTDEQTPKVQVIFDQQKEARAALVKESQGTPDPAKLKALDADALRKVIGLLTPAQRTALLAGQRGRQ